MTTNLYVVVIVEYIFVGSGLFKKCLTLILKPSIQSAFKIVKYTSNKVKQFPINQMIPGVISYLLYSLGSSGL